MDNGSLGCVLVACNLQRAHEVDRMRRHGAGEPDPGAGAGLQRSSGGCSMPVACALLCVIVCEIVCEIVCVSLTGPRPRDRTTVC